MSVITPSGISALSGISACSGLNTCSGLSLIPPAVSAYTSVFSTNYDGTNQYNNVGAVDSILSSTTNTIALRFKYEDTNLAIQTLMAMDNGYTATNSTRTFFIVYDTRNAISNRLSVGVYGSGTNVYKDIRYNDLDTIDNDVHSLVLTMNCATDTYTLHIDGVLATPSVDTNGAGGAPSSLYLNSIPLTLACRNNNGSQDRFFKGNLDQVGVWDAVLSADAAALVGSSLFDLTADSGDYTNSSDLTHLQEMEDGSGTSSTDGSTNSNDGTLVNGVTWEGGLSL